MRKVSSGMRKVSSGMRKVSSGMRKVLHVYYVNLSINRRFSYLESKDQKEKTTLLEKKYLLQSQNSLKIRCDILKNKTSKQIFVPLSLSKH
jgi:hypothetical protein